MPHLGIVNATFGVVKVAFTMEIWHRGREKKRGWGRDLQRKCLAKPSKKGIFVEKYYDYGF